MGSRVKGQGTLPARYADEEWMRPFRRGIRDSLEPGCRVLDVGSGSRPAIAVDQRPPGCTYVGLDLSADELRRAPAGAYDEAIVGDVTTPRPELRNRFDLVVSWQVLEHVKPLDAVIENVRSYLVPGGRFVAQLSGTFSFFGLLGRMVPHRLAAKAMNRLLSRDETSVFPTYYHRCWHAALVSMGKPWSAFSVEPMHAGAGYLSFMPPLQRLYLRYEEWIIHKELPNLATHYVIIATK